MKKILLLALVLLQIVTLSCSKDKSPDEDTFYAAENRMNVSYGNKAGQKYDLYLPAGRSSQKTKVIVLVHGGGWVEGDKSDMDFLIPFIQQTHPHHAIVNVNYVLADLNTPAFPNQFLDLQTVLNKLTSEREQLHILPQFALIGTSAGAHISLMYDYVYDTTDQVKMVADIVGPTDFTDPFYTQDPNFPILMAFLVDESAYPPGTDYARELSPALQVSAASSPTQMFYGDADPLVPLSNAQKLTDALNDHQIDHSLTVYSGGHGDWAPDDIENAQAQISTYINSYLEVLD